MLLNISFKEKYLLCAMKMVTFCHNGEEVSQIISIKYLLFKNYNKRNNSSNLENMDFPKAVELLTVQI